MPAGNASPGRNATLGKKAIVGIVPGPQHMAAHAVMDRFLMENAVFLSPRHADQFAAGVQKEKSLVDGYLLLSLELFFYVSAKAAVGFLSVQVHFPRHIRMYLNAAPVIPHSQAALTRGYRRLL